MSYTVNSMLYTVSSFHRLLCFKLYTTSYMYTLHYIPHTFYCALYAINPILPYSTFTISFCTILLLWYVILLCCAVPCHAMPCHAVLCNAMLGAAFHGSCIPFTSGLLDHALQDGMVQDLLQVLEVWHQHRCEPEPFSSTTPRV